jgi:hypothetical protein
MTQQRFMGPGLLLPPLFKVTKLCAFVAVGDWSTGRATVSIDPDVPARAIWQAEDLDEKWRQFGLRNIFIHARKVLLHAVNLRHKTDGFTSPPQEVVLTYNYKNYLQFRDNCHEIAVRYEILIKVRITIMLFWNVSPFCLVNR